MNCLLIENNQITAKRIQTLTKKAFGDSIYIKNIGSLQEAWICLKLYPHPDFIILNSNLENGDIYKIFEDIEINCPIIIVAPREKFIIKAFNINIFDFLIEPINERDLKRSIEKVFNYFSLKVLVTPYNKKSHCIYLKFGSKFYFTNLNHISFIQKHDDFALLVTKDGTRIKLPANVDSLFEQLRKFKFFPINRSLVINFDSILRITYKKEIPNLHLKQDQTQVISIPKNRIQYFNHWLNKYSA